MPLTGQMKRPEPCLTGAGGLHVDAGEPRGDLGLLLLERGEVVLELVAVRAGGDERLAACRSAPPRGRRWRSTSPSLISRISAARFATIAVTSLWRASRLVEPLPRPRPTPSLASRTRSMIRPSWLGDALHELRPLEQVGEAVGLEDHRDHVGLVGLVERDEPVAEHRPRLGELRAQLGEPDPLAPQPVLQLLRAPRAWRRGRSRPAPGARSASSMSPWSAPIRCE